MKKKHGFTYQGWEVRFTPKHGVDSDALEERIRKSIDAIGNATKLRPSQVFITNIALNIMAKHNRGYLTTTEMRMLAFWFNALEAADRTRNFFTLEPGMDACSIMDFAIERVEGLAEDALHFAVSASKMTGGGVVKIYHAVRSLRDAMIDILLPEP